MDRRNVERIIIPGEDQNPRTATTKGLGPEGLPLPWGGPEKDERQELRLIAYLRTLDH